MAIELTVLFTIRQSRVTYLMAIVIQLDKMDEETQCLCRRGPQQAGLDRVTAGEKAGDDEGPGAQFPWFEGTPPLQDADPLGLPWGSAVREQDLSTVVRRGPFSQGGWSGGPGR